MASLAGRASEHARQRSVRSQDSSGRCQVSAPVPTSCQPALCLLTGSSAPPMVQQPSPLEASGLGRHLHSTCTTLPAHEQHAAVTWAGCPWLLRADMCACGAGRPAQAPQTRRASSQRSLGMGPHPRLHLPQRQPSQQMRSLQVGTSCAIHRRDPAWTPGRLGLHSLAELAQWPARSLGEAPVRRSARARTLLLTWVHCADAEADDDEDEAMEEQASVPAATPQAFAEQLQVCSQLLVLPCDAVALACLLTCLWVACTSAMLKQPPSRMA